MQWDGDYKTAWEPDSNIPEQVIALYFALKQDPYFDDVPAVRAKKRPTSIPADYQLPSNPPAQPPPPRRSTPPPIFETIFFLSETTFHFSIHSISCFLCFSLASLTSYFPSLILCPFISLLPVVYCCSMMCRAPPSHHFPAALSYDTASVRQLVNTTWLSAPLKEPSDETTTPGSFGSNRPANLMQISPRSFTVEPDIVIALILPKFPKPHRGDNVDCPLSFFLFFLKRLFESERRMALHQPAGASPLFEDAPAV